jgi:Na+/melibiose symporter-like transporter
VAGLRRLPLTSRGPKARRPLRVLSHGLADILDSQELRTGRRQEGIFSSSLSFSGKVTSGLGVFVGGLVIDLLQFPRGALPSEVDPGLLFRLGVVLGVGVPLLHLIPLSLITRYKLTRAEHARIREALMLRRARE